MSSSHLAAATASLLLDVLTEALDRRLAAGSRRHRVRAHAVLDLLRHGQESLLDVGRVLGRRLEEGNVELVRERLGRSVVDHLLGREIRLVTDEQLVHTLDSVAVNLLQPLLHVRERVAVRNVVDDNDTVCSCNELANRPEKTVDKLTAVVGRGDGAEALLASSVPLFRGIVIMDRRQGDW